jgi:hypothetical protein
MRQQGFLEDFLRRLPKTNPEELERLRLVRQNELKRVEELAAERKAERKLVAQLIDAGYRSLASKLHPDKGGSPDAMSRLSRVRDQVKRQLGLKVKK